MNHFVTHLDWEDFAQRFIMKKTAATTRLGGLVCLALLGEAIDGVIVSRADFVNLSIRDSVPQNDLENDCQELNGSQLDRLVYCVLNLGLQQSTGLSSLVRLGDP
jgi:hypothetical protein